MIKLLTIISVCLILVGCDSKSLTTNMLSSNFSTNKEKIEFLEQYLKLKRKYKKLDFYINYQDNSTGLIPGPSDWDICLIAVVPSSELDLWVSKLKKINKTPELKFLSKVPTDIDYSKVTEWYYHSTNSFVGIDRIENIIMYRNEKH